MKDMIVIFIIVIIGLLIFNATHNNIELPISNWECKKYHNDHCSTYIEKQHGEQK